MRNADKINWVMSFKDVYHKFVDSYQRMGQAGTSLDDDDLDMPCFYVRSKENIALFKIDPETRTPVAELIPSLNLAKLVKESMGPGVYTIQNIYDDEEDANNA